MSVKRNIRASYNFNRNLFVFYRIIKDNLDSNSLAYISPSAKSCEKFTSKVKPSIYIYRHVSKLKLL